MFLEEIRVESLTVLLADILRLARRIELATGRGHRGLDLDDLKDQHRLKSDSPAIDIRFHLVGHPCLLRDR